MVLWLFLKIIIILGIIVKVLWILYSLYCFQMSFFIWVFLVVLFIWNSSLWGFGWYFVLQVLDLLLLLHILILIIFQKSFQLVLRRHLWNIVIWSNGLIDHRCGRWQSNIDIIERSWLFLLLLLSLDGFLATLAAPLVVQVWKLAGLIVLHDVGLCHLVGEIVHVWLSRVLVWRDAGRGVVWIVNFVVRATGTWLFLNSFVMSLRDTLVSFHLASLTTLLTCRWACMHLFIRRSVSFRGLESISGHFLFLCGFYGNASVSWLPWLFAGQTLGSRNFCVISFFVVSWSFVSWAFLGLLITMFRIFQSFQPLRSVIIDLIIRFNPINSIFQKNVVM